MPDQPDEVLEVYNMAWCDASLTRPALRRVRRKVPGAVQSWWEAGRPIRAGGDLLWTELPYTRRCEGVPDDPEDLVDYVLAAGGERWSWLRSLRW